MVGEERSLREHGTTECASATVSSQNIQMSGREQRKDIQPNCSPRSPFSSTLLGARSRSAVRICFVFLARGLPSFLACQAGDLNGRGT